MKNGLEQLAFRIADVTARSYVESFCLHARDLRWYLTGGLDPRDKDDVHIALRYMKLRGDALPYKVERKRGSVRFIDDEAAK